jgi:predicted nucleotide-binding protein
MRVGDLQPAALTISTFIRCKPKSSLYSAFLQYSTIRHSSICAKIRLVGENLATRAAQNRRVFVVHGRNDRLRREVFEFLRAIGLEPLEWGQVRGLTKDAAPTVDTIIRTGFKHACATVVVLAGEDFAWLMPEYQRPTDGADERRAIPQPRANVLFEAGVAMGMMPTRTVLATWGSLRPMSDWAGFHMVRLENPIDNRQSFANALQTAGAPVDLTGTDWHSAGDFKTSRDSLDPSEIPASLKLAVRDTRCWCVCLASEHEWHKTGKREPESQATNRYAWRSFSCIDHAVYGPYIVLEPGSYRAWFRLRVSQTPGPSVEVPSQQRTDASGSIVRLDVPAAGSITDKVVTLADVTDGEYRLYCVPFELRYVGPIELRVLQTASGWTLDIDYTALTS